jgi:hypothetical protein
MHAFGMETRISYQEYTGLKAEALADLDRRRAFAERQRLAELGALSTRTPG